MANDKTTKTPEQPVIDSGPGKETPPAPPKEPEKVYQLFSSMRDGNIVMLSLRTLLFKIGRECRTPKTNIFGGIEKSISQISGATLFHVSITVLQLPCCKRGKPVNYQLNTF